MKVLSLRKLTIDDKIIKRLVINSATAHIPYVGLSPDISGMGAELMTNGNKFMFILF